MFEMFLGEHDRGEMTRAEATDGVAALASIIADPSTSIRLDAEGIGAPGTRARDAVLTAIADDRGGDHRDARSARRVVRLEIELSEIAWIARHYRHQIAVADLTDPMELLGHFLVATTSSGERLVREYESGSSLDDAWANSHVVINGLGGS